MCLYAFISFLYLLLLKQGIKLAIANSLWNTRSLLTVTLMGYFIFHQKLTIKQIFGIFITIIVVYFLQ